MSRYGDLSREQLIQLLEKRDREKKLGLVWERDEIEADKAVDENFIAATLDETLSDKSSPWRNLVIEGDNFDALRWLRMTYAGRVKCIYVDPPYNTGSKDWVYNDNYMDKADRYRFSTWLEFLFRRFTLARELLTEDGVILVSINDENRALMELMLDQALPGMRVGSFVWRNRSGGNDPYGPFLSVNHEHILIFGKPGFCFGGTDRSYSGYGNPDCDPRGDWTSDNLRKGADRFERPNAFFPIYNPETDIYYPANPGQVWRYVSKATGGARGERYVEDLVADNRIKWPDEEEVRVFKSLNELKSSIRDDNVPRSGSTPLLSLDTPNLDFFVGKKIGYGTPRLKRFRSELKSETQPLSSWIVPRSESKTIAEKENYIMTGFNDEGTKSLKSVFGSKVFDYPKPVSLVQELVRQASSSGDIVLDFFAGSATTAQAVMELNAEDGGDRSFIMVSSTEATSDEPDKNICRDITAERIRRLNASDNQKYADLAAEFAYLKTREIDFENIDYDLKPSEAWNALEAIHRLPLTPYDTDAAFNEHAEDTQVLIYVDRVSDAVFARINALVNSGIGVTVYSWSPGQLRERLKGLNVEIQSVRSTLVKKFQQ